MKLAKTSYPRATISNFVASIFLGNLQCMSGRRLTSETLPNITQKTQLLKLLEKNFNSIFAFYVAVKKTRFLPKANNPRNCYS